MTNDIFRECRERVTAEAVARFYGFEPTRGGFIRCPFHQGDTSPSLKLYPGDRGWFCFGCGKGGDSIDLTGRLFGLNALEAVRRLNDDLHLGLPVDHPQGRTEAQRRRELSAAHEAFKAWKTDLIRQLNDCFRMAHLALKNLDDLSDAECLAIRWQVCFEHWADTLECGTPEEQMEIFRERQVIQPLIDQILKSTPTKSGAA